MIFIDPTDQSATMLAAAPDPRCATNSRFEQAITRVRGALERRFVSSDRRNPKVPVIVTGIGFFDTPHGQDGAAWNAIELHPVLNIEFR